MSRTGEDNAADFVKTVKIIAKECVYDCFVVHEESWPWMANEEWRNRVLNELALPSILKNIEFIEPSPIGATWTFLASIDKSRDSYSKRNLTDPE